MPVGVVKTAEDEIAWERAKARAREEYPDASGQQFYRIVMAIYKKMTHYQPSSSPARSRNRRRRSTLFVALITVLLLMSARQVALAGEPSLVCDKEADYALGIEDYSTAIRLHQEVVKRNPGDALAHYHLGFAFGVQHDEAAELREYLRAQELGLQQWDFFLNLGIARMERHEFDEAIKALTRATELGPRYAETHFNLGLAYEGAGLLRRARDEISAALRLDPDQRDAENELAVVYAEMGKPEAARAIWTRLLESDPSDEAALANLATLQAISTHEGSAGTLARSR